MPRSPQIRLSLMACAHRRVLGLWLRMNVQAKLSYESCHRKYPLPLLANLLDYNLLNNDVFTSYQPHVHQALWLHRCASSTVIIVHSINKWHAWGGSREEKVGTNREAVSPERASNKRESGRGYHVYTWYFLNSIQLVGHFDDSLCL